MEKYLMKLDEFSIYSKDNICYIDLCNHLTKNAIGLKFATEIDAIITKDNSSSLCLFEEWIEHENIVLIVVRSKVKDIFSSGGNIKELVNANRKDYVNYGSMMRSFCNMLSTSLIPTVTLLHGNAYGGGMELALSTQFRWAIGKQIKFYFSQSKFSLPGGWGGMSRLAQLCPTFSTQKINALFLAQDVMIFEQLYSLGIIDIDFPDKAACEKKLFEWRDRLLQHTNEFKLNFYKRCEFEGKELEKYDIQFFDKYFLSEIHKNYLSNFLKKKF